MTDPVTRTGSAPVGPQPLAAPNPVTVVVSRAQAAPIYVYRLTDTATGRVLVEIPSQQTVDFADIPGARLDTKA